MSKILITGGTGFIGFHLAKRLADISDNEIVLIGRNRERVDRELKDLLDKPNVKLIEADLTEKKSFEKIGKNYDYIYHLAGLRSFKDFKEIPNEVLRIGLQSTLNLLDWIKSENNNLNVKVLYTSTSDVYAGVSDITNLKIPTPENIPLVVPNVYEPRWSYAGQKIAGELLFIHYSKAYNFRMVIIRPNNVYGPRAGEDAMIPKIISRIEKRMDPFPIISPLENRSSCYVDDLVKAMVLSIESRKTDGQIYHVGGEGETTVQELIDIMFDICGWKPKNFDIKENPDDKSKHSLPDSSKIKEDTGWMPETTLENGLRKTIEWYTNRENNS